MFGDKLRELRKNKYLSQDALGKEFGVRGNVIWDWENGRSQPSIEKIVDIAKFFDVSTDYLFGLNDRDIDRIKELNRILRETNLIKDREMTLSEFKKAIEIVDILLKDKEKEKDTNE